MPTHFSGNLDRATHERTRKRTVFIPPVLSPPVLLLEVRAQRAHVKPMPSMGRQRRPIEGVFNGVQRGAFFFHTLFVGSVFYCGSSFFLLPLPLLCLRGLPSWLCLLCMCSCLGLLTCLLALLAYLAGLSFWACLARLFSCLPAFAAFACLLARLALRLLAWLPLLGWLCWLSCLRLLDCLCFLCWLSCFACLACFARLASLLVCLCLLCLPLLTLLACAENDSTKQS